MAPSPLCNDPASSRLSPFSPALSLLAHGRLANPPFSAPCASMALPSASSSPLRHCAASVFQFDKPYSVPSDATPPPLPPKPTLHLPEQQCEEGLIRPRAMSTQHFPNHAPVFARRTSLSSLDHFMIGEAESRSRRPNINMSCLHTDESYVPMASPAPPLSAVECDGYIPMSPVTFLKTNCGAESSTLMPQPGDLAPPPIHRHLKPSMRRARPPPLDLRGLSTITECPTHFPLSRTIAEACFSVNCLPLERRLENGDNPRNDDTNGTTMDPRQDFFNSDGAVQSWARRSNLDYLSLDFNSASPSPVQKQKPFLSDEHRVDYVLVDEKKTQALQSTKMEWTDVRQSKT